MKTKILFTFLLLASLAYNSSAITIVISGGNRHNKFSYVRLDERSVICRGSGNITCPVDFGVRDHIRTTHKVNAVVDFVYDQLEKGTTKGETEFEGSLPVSWNYNNEELKIDISDDGSTMLEPYEESEK